MSGLSVPFLSMAENGQRTLSRRDHASALAAALRVRPAEIAPSVIPGFGEWAPAPPVPASAFPPVGNDIAIARHRELARQLIGSVSRGDTYAARAWLRRMARDPEREPLAAAGPAHLAGHLPIRSAVASARGERGAPGISRPRRTGAGWMTAG
jgi:hypothetical protein